MNKAVLVFLGGLLGTAALAGVEERSAAKQILDEYLGRYENLEQALAQPSFDVVDRVLVCLNCHGEGGSSAHKEIPSLADQNPYYLVEQLLVFQKAVRYPEMMHGLAQAMDTSTMAAIALHFSIMERRLTMAVDREQGAKGEGLYQALCANCHGADGRGANESYANLQRQRPDYLAVSMKRFRDASSKRSSHEMQAAVKGLTDAEIEELAQYLAGLGH